MITSLMPMPKLHFETATGIPLVGGKLYTYLAGTTTLKDTYTDASGTAKHENPITLNLRGEPPAPIFWSGNYRVELRDALGNLIYTVDNYNTDPGDISGVLDNVLAEFSESDGAAKIGFNHGFEGAVNETVADVLRETVHVNRFGGNLKLALQKVPEYTTILLDVATYDISGLYTNDFNLGAGPFVGNMKRGIRLQGAGMPRVSTDGTALTGGTIILGTLFNLADDFEAYDLGIDVGSSVCANLYGGAFAEGFIPGLNPDYPATRTTIKGFKCDRIIALGNVPTAAIATWKHTVLCENLENPTIGDIIAVGGYHTYVDKCIGMACNSVRAFGGAGEAVFFGANIGNACRFNQYSKIRIDSWTINGVEQKAGGVVFNSNQAAAPFLSKVKIGELMMRNVRAGVDAVTDGGDSFITDCWIGHFDGDLSTNGAAMRFGYGPTRVQRFVVASHNIVTNARTFELGANSDTCHIGEGVQTIVADAKNPIMAFNTLRYSHGRIQMMILTAQTAQFIIARTMGDVFLGLITIGGPAGIPTNRYISSVQGALVLSNNFVDGGLVGQASNGAIYFPYRVELTGSAKASGAGADLVLGTVTPPPRVNMRFTVPSETVPGTFVQRCLELTSTGLILARGNTVAGEIITLNQVNYSLLV